MASSRPPNLGGLSSNDAVQVTTKRQLLLAKEKPAKKRRVVVEEGIRDVGNEKHTTAAFPSAFPSQSKRNVQEGRRRSILLVASYPSATASRSCISLEREKERLLAPIMHTERASLHYQQRQPDYHELDMAIAALSQHRDPLYDLYSRGSFSSLNSRLAATLALSQPSRLALSSYHEQELVHQENLRAASLAQPSGIDRLSQSSLSNHDDQELFQEILQRTRAAKEQREQQSYYGKPAFETFGSCYDTHAFPQEHASVFPTRWAEQMRARQAHDYSGSFAIASKMPAAVASPSYQQRKPSSRNTDTFPTQLWEHPTSFSQLQQQETALAKKIAARETLQRRDTQGSLLLCRAGASGRDHLQSPSLFQKADVFEGGHKEENQLELGGRSNGTSPSVGSKTTPQYSPPPCQEGTLRPYSERTILPLSGEEDETWLSEFLCFVRSDLVEVFRASNKDVASRVNSRKIFHHQIGIRCRFCAHIPYIDRACRSATFPSSVDRTYQSLTMMIRDHFVDCTSVPRRKWERFAELKTWPSSSITGARRYWIDSAKNLGMVDTPTKGIMWDANARLAGHVPQLP
jgi:hypothetical protein